MGSSPGNEALKAVAPFLRWAGSKRQILPILRHFWSDSYKRYVEPFAGSAALFFALAPPRAVLGDINSDLMSTFKAVRADPDAVFDALRLLPTGEANYYRIRSTSAGTSTDRAARFIYLNRFCFNGLYRTNKAGAFNVPYGAPKNWNIPTAEQLKTCSALLAKARLTKSDFRATLRDVRQDDFVYLDPPYATSARRVFVEYGAAPFSASDLRDLADALRALSLRGAYFLLSYADCPEVRSTLGDWPRRRLLTRRNVAGFSGARRNQFEVYISNIPSFTHIVARIAKTRRRSVA